MKTTDEYNVYVVKNGQRWHMGTRDSLLSAILLAAKTGGQVDLIDVARNAPNLTVHEVEL